MKCQTSTKSYCSSKCKNISQSFLHSPINDDLHTGRKKYYGPNWLHQRAKARARDQYTCQNHKCAITEKEYGKELSVHHITPFVYFRTYKDANHLDNLISLCEPCHRKIHVGENHALKFKPEKIVFLNEINKVRTQQFERAQTAVFLLLNTDMPLTEISKEVGISYSKIQAIYCGKRWKELYEIAPREVRPRAMTLAKNINCKEKLRKVVELLLSTDLTMREIIEDTGVSRTTLYRIYNGETNKDLYKIAPCEIRPRYEIYRKNRKNKKLIEENGKI
jgi:5-methylcytosine-specific restriction endonuclease McrA/predicted DNA-binding protein YlxM (UPF0122 family)